MQDDAQLSRIWFPWHDKITCTLDILMHLPRSVFSQRQLDLFLWLLKVNGVDDVPSVKTMQGLNAKLQKMCGIDSIGYKGALGHNYYVNDLAQILAQEMANPRVRPHLHFYPEDTQGVSLAEARQGARWLHEIPDHLITPMARIGTQDFYIHEPAMLRSGIPCIPVRWFTRLERGQHVLFAKCWGLEVVDTDTSRGWRVIQHPNWVVRQDEFLKNFPELCQDAMRYGIPDPTCIIDVVDPVTMAYSAWTFTEPQQGNQWRSRAKGHRVLGFALWAYCDDTSGNLSKKWNEHNSFLITPAGLPREESQKEYNIHFLSTSNIAPPLEMMDGVVDQLEEAQSEGIWAWDCELNEPVLLVPFILALLGDNPMQSEFACHIGLAGKFFCRNCWVKGHDQASDEGSDASGAMDDAAATDSSPPKPKSRRKKALESMADMVTRVKAFIKVGRPRHKQETVSKLRSFFNEASKLDTKTKVGKMRTESGIKDTFQMVFLDQMFASYKGKRGTDTREAALRAKVESLPANTTSPVWRIKELDPHQDTPVEVLHVVLLGFVKYLWRDVVQNQLKNKDDKKSLLATRLSSFDVSGLGISPLAGTTLVQYSGSLTGRDFRAIAQAGPFVLYDLVSPDCYETWVALSHLIPLIWQPVIINVQDHLTLLEKEIQYFLLCAARWTTRWFNKPKFHILLHLVEHIRRLGPASLFATESFESFNAIIRAKSVHSNRQAPSRDIARAFAQGNRIRHLLAGGLFVPDEKLVPETSAQTTNDTVQNRTFVYDHHAWLQIGPGPADLVRGRSTVTQYLGLDDHVNELLTARVFPSAGAGFERQLFKTCADVRLENGDLCRIGQYVIARAPGTHADTYMGCVEEIVQVAGSAQDLRSQPDMILVRRANASESADTYRMPRVTLESHWHMTLLADLLCTVNVQHNCTANHCGIMASRTVWQERQRTDQTQTAVTHNNPADLVLNTAQMRDAVHVQHFRIHSPILDPDHIIHTSAAREVTAQKVTMRATRVSSTRATSVAAGRAGGGLQSLDQPRQIGMLRERR
ncbi:hypothetical protein B0H21DRAFT_693918 [Amylocystis lapponica]|nr:hypothetical protein B0H21DRAFT_693918 [Amylocystis lapponica]